MKAIVVRRLGDPEELALEDSPDPGAGPGRVVVRLAAAGVNFADTERRRGIYEAVALPWTPGAEGAGVVESVGLGVDPALVGRRVAVLAPTGVNTGTYAERAAVPQDRLLPLPDGISFEQGAALPLQGLTAHGIVFRAARVRPGETVLVHAAAGGVGLLAVQLARRAGAERVLGVVSSAAKAAVVEEAGAEVFVYSPDLHARLLAATGGRGVDVVLDSVGLATQELSIQSLAPFGRLVFFGAASGDPRPIDPDHLYDKSLQIGAFSLWTPQPPGAFAAAFASLTDWLAAGALKLTISRVFPLAEASEAHRLLESRATVGKLVLGM
jgi:NADPH2:quinone reductase